MAYFDTLMNERDIRPTVLSPLWDMAVLRWVRSRADGRKSGYGVHGGGWG